MSTQTTTTAGKQQACSTPSCPNPAAFTTRSKPAWCRDCIDDLLRQGGLRALEPFPGLDEWRFTACLECGVEAHYKFNYTLEKNLVAEKTCRACYWRIWAARDRNQPHNANRRALLALMPTHTARQILELMPAPEGQALLNAYWWPCERIIAHLDKHGFEFIATTAEYNDGGDPVVGSCRKCGKIRAARLGDFAWGCTCKQNTRSSSPGSTRGARKLLAESEHPALAWWDHERNAEATLRTITVRATRVCHWWCTKCGHRFEAKVNDVTALYPSCPVCAAAWRKEWTEENERWKVTPVAEVPELAAAWADEADPLNVMVGSNRLRRFRCPEGHHPRINPLTFLKSGCPSCRGAETRKTNQRMLADILPEIASQWHPTLNGNVTPQTVVSDSKRTVWWLSDCCGAEWQDTPRDRDKYARQRCPRCQSILGSLAWEDPGLAAEWSPANPISEWHVRPHAKTDFLPEWICATNAAHVWQSALSGRSNGAECPECRKVGKSKVELAHHASAEEVFSGARSGVTLRDPAFTTRKSWSADISVDLDGRTLVIEYDGSYWHTAPAKILVDEQKTADFLGAGYVVVRLREDNLPPLALEHPLYKEVRVYSAAPRPRVAMEEIQDWLATIQQAGIQQ